MIRLQETLTAKDLAPRLQRLWELSAAKIEAIEAGFDPAQGAPVYTVEGRYTTRGWTEWTQGFQYGSVLLQYDATGDERYLDRGRDATRQRMAAHLTHTGVHDHGFNNVSTYGALLRLMVEGRIPDDPWQRDYYELALRCSGAVQAGRWTDLGEGEGFIHSFNGPHSLFADTMRSLRALAVAHLLGHVLMGENDRRVSLFDRLVAHARTTARYNVYYGEGRDGYDVPGRVAHESIFNVTDGRYRCPSTQQGYSPFTTWTRGLAWILCGYAEQLEFLATQPDEVFAPHGGRDVVTGMMLRAARASADFYIGQSPSCGVPYWDTGAPGLAALGAWMDRPADPFNDREPVDSSAAAIAAQGLLRLGEYLGADGAGARYWQAGLTVADTLFDEPYLSTDPAHQGLILHSVYHWPNRWDAVPAGRRVACGESSMWGDYHARELALYLQRAAGGGRYLAFHNVLGGRA
jgi:unsaturated chondroitin disaccharide hydrolase